MKPDHTPGPWTARDAEDGYYADMNVVRDDGLAVAAAVMNGNITRAETAANAFLIAAAPEMLAALESAPIPGRLEEMMSFRDRQDKWLREVRNPAVEKAQPW